MKKSVRKNLVISIILLIIAVSITAVLLSMSKNSMSEKEISNGKIINIDNKNSKEVSTITAGAVIENNENDNTGDVVQDSTTVSEPCIHVNFYKLDRNNDTWEYTKTSQKIKESKVIIGESQGSIIYGNDPLIAPDSIDGYILVSSYNPLNDQEFIYDLDENNPSNNNVNYYYEEDFNILGKLNVNYSGDIYGIHDKCYYNNNYKFRTYNYSGVLNSKIIYQLAKPLDLELSELNGGIYDPNSLTVTFSFDENISLDIPDGQENVEAYFAYADLTTEDAGDLLTTVSVETQELEDPNKKLTIEPIILNSKFIYDTFYYQTKVNWVDDSLAVRPEAVYSVLSRKIDTDTKFTQVKKELLDSYNDWMNNFLDLPKYDDYGNKYFYMVSQEEYATGELQRYSSEIYIAKVSQDDTSDSRIINITNTYISEKKDLTVSINWDDISEATRPEEMIVHYKDSDGLSHDVTLNSENNWLSTISIEKYSLKTGNEITFSDVSETFAEGYTLSNTSIDMTSITLTNTYSMPMIEKRIVKDWNIENPSFINAKPDSIDVEVLANGEHYSNETVSVDTDWYKDLELPKYETGTLNTINYTINEITNSDDFITTIDDFKITNTFSEVKTDVEANVIWKNDTEELRPTSVEIELYADGITTGKKIILTKDTLWTAKFEGVSKYSYSSTGRNEINYSIKEIINKEGYESSIDGLTAINTYSMPTTSCKINKVWINDTLAIRPSNVQVQLLADGILLDKIVTLDDTNNWSQTINDLPKYQDGTLNLIEYSIKELNIPENYDSIISSNDEGFTIKNTYTAPKVSKLVTKNWIDDTEVLRPETVEVELLKDNLATGIKLNLSKTTNWMGTFGDLLKYKEGTLNEINYSVKENTETEGYTSTVNGMNITNTYIMPKVSKKAVKLWNGDNSVIRPENVEIALLKNGEVTGITAQISANSNWEYTFENLDKYKEGTLELNEYSIEELNVAEGYVSTVYGMNVTNTYTMPKVSKTVTKTWIGDTENIRPESVVVDLYGNGEDKNIQVTLSKENNWQYTFENLPKYEEGSLFPIEYTVKELNVGEGYVSTIDGMNVTNTYTMPKISTTVNKTWEGDNLVIRPTSVEVELTKDGIATGIKATLTADTNWKYEFTNLDKYKEGTLIPAEYSVKELNVGEGYVSTIDGMNITNTYTMPTVSKTVTKIWQNDVPKYRPESIYVDFLENGEYNGHMVELTAAENWKKTVTDLPKYKEGTLDQIDYSLDELNISEGYTSVVNGMNIINTYTMPTVQATCEIKWQDDSENVRPDKVIVELLKNGENTGRTIELLKSNNWEYTLFNLDKYKEGTKEENTYSIVMQNPLDDYISTTEGMTITNKYVMPTIEREVVKTWVGDTEGTRPSGIIVELYANGEDTGKNLEINKANNWKAKFINMPKYLPGTKDEISYSISEINPGEGYISSVDGFNVTNTYTKPTISKKLQKKWLGDNLTIRPAKVLVDILANGNLYTTVELNNENNWTYDFPSLPKYDDGTYNQIIYSVKELNVPEGYTSSIDDFVITNTYSAPKVSKTVKKTWIGDTESIRPQSVQVELLANNRHYLYAILNVENNWEYTFDNLLKYTDGTKDNIKYSIKEISLFEGYTSSITYDGDIVNISNTYEAPTKNITIYKKWVSDNSYVRPNSINVELLANGTHYDTQVLDSSVDWQYQYLALPKYEEGTLNEINYSVAEVNVPENYTSTIDGYTITNTYTAPIIQKTITKTWIGDTENIRPELVEVNVYSNGEFYGSLNLTKAMDWKTTINVPKYVENTTNEIDYTIKEVNLSEGYVSGISGMNITNTYTMPKVKKVISKKWVGDSETIRPIKVDVQLLANGKDYATVELNSSNDWKYIFDNLPKYEEGTLNLINYTVNELNLGEGYTNNVNYQDENIVITNTYTAPKINKTIQKIWKNDNQSLRPNNIQAVILANGVESEYSVTLSTQNDWKYEFRLPKYEDGTLNVINYTVKEVTVPEGYVSNVDDFTITNIYSEPVIDIPVNINWIDDSEELRPQNVVVSILADNKKLDQQIICTKDSNWSSKFVGLQKYQSGTRTPINYTISVESDVGEGYTTEINGYNISNTYVAPTVEKNVYKEWLGDDLEVRPQDIDIELLANGKSNGLVATLKDDNNWSYMFENLPKYEELTRNEINYTVKEVTVPDGYTSTINGMVITNTHDLITIDKEVNISWVNDTENVRPENVIVKLFADGVDTNKTLELTKESDWKASFEGLQKYESQTSMEPIKYTIEVDDLLEGYTTDIQDFNIVNTYSEPKKDLAVTINWDDLSNEYGKRPLNVRVIIKSGDEIVAKQLVSSIVNTTQVFEVQKYESGTKNIKQYTVDEEEVKSNDLLFYSKIINEYTITNKYKVPDTKGIINAQKVWDDLNDLNKKRPNSIKILLKANDKVIDEKEVSNSNEWKCEFTDLFKYDQINGNEIKYELDEKESNIGDLLYYTKNINNGVITNKYTRPQINCQVVVKYLDKDTNQVITKEDVLNGNIDDEYSTEYKDIYGYNKVDEVPENAKGIYTSEPQNVIYYYTRKETSISEKHVDEEGKELLPSEEHKGYVNDTYTIPSKTIDYYKVKDIPSNYSGVMKEDVQEITYVYKKMDADLKLDSWVTSIQNDDVVIQGNTYETKDNPIKAEIVTKNIYAANVKVNYKIRITNIGELPMKIGQIIDVIPNELTYNSANNTSWKYSEGVISTDEYKDEELLVGESKEIDLVLTWKNSNNNFGEIKNISQVINSNNEAGFEEKDLVNNKDESIIALSIKTGLEAQTIKVIIISSLMLISGISLGIYIVIKNKKKIK